MTLAEPDIGAFLVAFARCAALVAAAPVIGDSGVPVRARLVVAVAIAIGAAANRPGVAYADVPAAAALELAYGVLVGVTARFILSRAAIAGQLMGLSLGLGFAAEYDVHAGENAGVLRTMLSTLAALAFVTCGGLSAIVHAAISAPATVSQLGLLGPALVGHAVSALGAGLAIAAPILIAALVANIGFAVLNRAVPAVNVFSVALSGVLIVGGLVLVATATGLVGSIGDVARAAVDALRS